MQIIYSLLFVVDGDYISPPNDNIESRFSCNKHLTLVAFVSFGPVSMETKNYSNAPCFTAIILLSIRKDTDDELKES